MSNEGRFELKIMQFIVTTGILPLIDFRRFVCQFSTNTSI